MTRIILASQSPRRKDFLERMNIGEFEAVPSGFDEVLDESRNADDVAKDLALGKAREVAKRFPDAIVIASDTIVAFGGRQLEKAKGIDEARQMLIDLAKEPSSIVTSIVVVQGEREVVDVDTVLVRFKPDSPAVHADRETYLATYDWQDKAGGYGIQSGAAPLIEYIEGEYDTAVGLPTKKLARMLAEFGIAATPVIEHSPVPQKT
jgi:septum formation protein